jgi:hypothetical protein
MRWHKVMLGTVHATKHCSSQTLPLLPWSWWHGLPESVLFVNGWVQGQRRRCLFIGGVESMVVHTAGGYCGSQEQGVQDVAAHGVPPAARPPWSTPAGCIADPPFASASTVHGAVVPACTRASVPAAEPCARAQITSVPPAPATVQHHHRACTPLPLCIWHPCPSPQARNALYSQPSQAYCTLRAA